MTPWILDAVRQLKCLGLKGFEHACSRDRQNRRPVPGVTAQAARSRHDSLQGTLHFNGDYREHHRYRASGELARSRNCRLCNLREPSHCRTRRRQCNCRDTNGSLRACRIRHGLRLCPVPHQSEACVLARATCVGSSGLPGPCVFPPPYSSSVLGGEDARGLLREAVASPIFSVGANAGSSVSALQEADPGCFLCLVASNTDGQTCVNSTVRRQVPYKCPESDICHIRPVFSCYCHASSAISRARTAERCAALLPLRGKSEWHTAKPILFCRV